MKKFTKKYLFTIIGVVVGATAGYFYWQQVGCSSGSRAITSSPTNSNIYGSIMGVFSIFEKDNKKGV